MGTLIGNFVHYERKTIILLYPSLLFLVIFLKLTAAKTIIQHIENKNKIRGAYVELGEKGAQRAHWANCTNFFSHYVRWL